MPVRSLSHSEIIHPWSHASLGEMTHVFPSKDTPLQRSFPGQRPNTALIRGLRQSHRDRQKRGQAPCGGAGWEDSTGGFTRLGSCSPSAPPRILGRNKRPSLEQGIQETPSCQHSARCLLRTGTEVSWRQGQTQRSHRRPTGSCWPPCPVATCYTGKFMCRTGLISV